MLKRWFILGLFMALLTGSALAQETGSVITYGSPVEGSISDQRTEEVWSLTLDSADRITVQVERRSGDLLPQITLRRPSGEVLTTTGPDGTGALARIDRYDLPAAGTYEVVVGRVDADTGVTEGRYSLTVDALATASLNPANQAVIADLEYGRALRGEITNTHWFHRYRLAASSADMIRVEVRRLSGGLQPEVAILNEGGEQMGYGWNLPSMDGALVERFELPAGGAYTIAVTRAGQIDGGTTGRYEITVSLLGAGEANLVLQRTPRSITYGVPVSGSIDARWYENWLLTAPSADTISVVIRAADGGNLVPMVAIFDPTGKELSRAWPDRAGTSTSINRFQLPAAGEYLIRAERSSGKLGGTSGPYTLTVTVSGTGADNPLLQAITGSLRMGAAITGEITDAQWENRWQFDGRAGQRVDIRAERLSGTLYPVLELLGPDGSVVAGAWFDASRARSEMIGAGLGQDGTYIIRIRRENDQNGQTRGDYRLALELHTP
jgi:hypothetical protein